MIAKVVLFLVLAAVAVQSYAPSEEVEEDLSIYGGIGGLIQRLEDIVKKGINGAKHAFDKLHNELVDKVKRIVETAKTKVGKQVNDLLAKIKNLKAEALAAKVDITPCLKDHEQRMLTLIKDFPARILGCGTSIITKSKNLIEHEKQLVEDTIGTVKSLAAEIKHCGLLHLKCQAGVAVKIAKAIVEIPAKIALAVTEAQRVITHLIPDAEQCVVQETAGLLPEEISIATDIETCIVGKIHPHKEA